MNGYSAPYLSFFADKTGDLVYRLRIPRGGEPQVLFISGSVRTLLGYSPEDFSDDPSLFARILFQDDSRLFRESACTLRLRAKDGSIRVIEARNAIITDPETGDLIIEGIGRDLPEATSREMEPASLDGILRAVGYAASCILTKGDWESRIDAVIRELGEAADASGAYLYTFEESHMHTAACLKGEWAADGLHPDNPVRLEAAKYGEGFALIRQGAVISGSVADLGSFGELVRLASSRTKSVLIVPIITRRKVSGFIGFNECRHERSWRDAEIQALEIAARIIGAAIIRDSDHHALEESEARFRGIFEHGPVGIVLADPGYMIIEANPAFSRMLGYSRDELLFLSFRDLTHQDDIPGNERGLHDLMQGKVPIYRLEKRYVRKGGSIFWADVTVAPVTFPDGNGYIAMIRDVSLRKAAEQKLAESEEMHRSFLQHFHGIVYRSVEEEPVFLHGAVTEITGYRADEIAAGNPLWSSLIHPADAPGIIERYNALYLSPGDRFGADYRIIHRDGSVRWVHEVIKHRVGESGISIIEASIYDITRRREAEEALSRSNAKLNLLQSITRHDIFNQLMGLSAYTELLKDQVTNPLGSEYCAGIEATIDRIHRISHFTHDYQKIGVQGPLWQDLRGVISRGFGDRSPDGIAIVNEVSGYEIYADPLLEKVVYNLVDNSAKYGGSSVSRFHVSCREVDGELWICLEDDGIGFDPSLKGHLFEYGAGKGTGLGLFLIKEILAITGIGIESAPGTLGGAAFRIRVPDGGWRAGVYNISRAS